MVSNDPVVPQRYPGTTRAKVDRNEHKTFLLGESGFIADGGNSGFQALNLALQTGARRLILVGFDMHARGGIHWHGKHPSGMSNPSDRHLALWRSRLDGTAAQLKAIGACVINASPSSALEAFPKMTMREALQC